MPIIGFAIEQEIEMAKLYRCFVRNWYRYDRYGMKVPDGRARRAYLPGARYLTEEEAIERCCKYNSKHNPGPLSRKAEYESYEA